MALRGRLALVGLAPILIAVALLGCSLSTPTAISESEPTDPPLPSLDATATVRSSFESPDVEGLTVEQGEAFPGVQVPDGYSDVRQFVVAYTSLKPDVTGEPPGPRTYFVYVGRSSANGTWEVLSAGTGP